jgi:hypothetical protein
MVAHPRDEWLNGGKQAGGQAGRPPARLRESSTRAAKAQPAQRKHNHCFWVGLRPSALLIFALRTKILMPQTMSEVLQRVVLALQTEIVMPETMSEVLQRLTFARQTEILMPENVSEMLQTLTFACQTKILRPQNMSEVLQTLIFDARQRL